MVLSYYLAKIPYSLIWQYKKFRGTITPVVFYAGSLLDITIFAPVQKHLKDITIVAKNKKIQRLLKQQGIDSCLLPVFPRGVIMARQAAYKFPYSKVKKICMRHGAYHFKRLASTESYNLLDAFFFSSQADLDFAKQSGIQSGIAVGFPKLDKMFDGSISKQSTELLFKSLTLDNNKKTILLTATWDASGVSAIHSWYEKLEQLAKDYNVLVTVHPWTSRDIVDIIKATNGVHFIQGYDILEYIRLADLCIGDTSSILAECCALDKPMITFKMKPHKRSVPHVTELIKSISWQVDDFDELLKQIPYSLKHADFHQQQRVNANKIMFDELDGKAGERAADEIIKFFPELKK